MTRASRQRGVALLLAVAVVAVLTLTVFPFLYEGRVERAVAANLYTSLQARHLAESGVAVAEGLLLADTDRGLDSLADVWAVYNNVPIAAGGGAASIVIVDEQAKLNLRLLVQGTNPVERRVQHLQQLLANLGQEPSLVEPLLDWLDTDDQPRPFRGAENPYYLGLTPPYETGKGLATVAELGLVKGWTRKVVEAVSPFVTVHGSGRVNLNTAPPEVLLALGLDGRAADSLLACREKAPFKQAMSFRDCPGLGGSVADNIAPFVSTNSGVFGVTATGSFRDSVAVVRAVLTRGSQVQRVYWRVE